jgi:hypothetical protein
MLGRLITCGAPILWMALAGNRSSTDDDSLIISDLDNQLGVLGWHTTSATVSAGFDSCVCPGTFTRSGDLLLDFTDRSLEIGSCLIISDLDDQVGVPP